MRVCCRSVGSEEAGYRYEAGNGTCPRDARASRAGALAPRFPDITSVGSVQTWWKAEPPLSGARGSGTVFFTNCNLRCVYCQNYPISQLGNGVEKTPEELAAQMIWLQDQGCHNLNLVTPSHVMPQILKSLGIARQQGFALPIVYNTNGYESLEALHLLDGIVDIYLPDLKYAGEEDGWKYSKVPRYSQTARAAIQEMHRQVGSELLWGEDGLVRRGLVIRHLILPNDIAGREESIRWIHDTLGKDVTMSIMAQY